MKSLADIIAFVWSGIFYCNHQRTSPSLTAPFVIIRFEATLHTIAIPLVAIQWLASAHSRNLIVHHEEGGGHEHDAPPAA